MCAQVSQPNGDYEKTIGFVPEPEATLDVVRVDDPPKTIVKMPQNIIDDSANMVSHTMDFDLPISFGPQSKKSPELPARYQVEEELGRGGMGAVYKARDAELGRDVAIKTLLKVDEFSLPRFLKESRTMAQINHPNVLHIYDVVSEGDEPCIIMEYIDGPNLAEVVRQEGPLTVEQICSYGAQTADGLDAAHTNATPVIHRDIKPHNLLLERGQNVKVADFGIATPVDQMYGLTRTGAVMGTCDYLPPEIEQDARSDLYSLGATLFHLATGRAPFAHLEQMLEKVDAILYTIPPDVNVVRNEEMKRRRIEAGGNASDVAQMDFSLPPPLADLIHTLLAKDPDDRIQTAAEASKILRRISAGVPVSVKRVPPEKNRKTSLVYAGAAVIMLTVAGMVFKLFRSDVSEEGYDIAGKQGVREPLNPGKDSLTDNSKLLPVDTNVGPEKSGTPDPTKVSISYKIDGSPSSISFFTGEEGEVLLPVGKECIPFYENKTLVGFSFYLDVNKEEGVNKMLIYKLLGGTYYPGLMVDNGGIEGSIIMTKDGRMIFNFTYPTDPDESGKPRKANHTLVSGIGGGRYLSDDQFPNFGSALGIPNRKPLSVLPDDLSSILDKLPTGIDSVSSAESTGDVDPRSEYGMQKYFVDKLRGLREIAKKANDSDSKGGLANRS